MNINRLTPQLLAPLEQLWISYLRRGEAYLLATKHAKTLLDKHKIDNAKAALEDLVEEGDEVTLEMFLQHEPTLNWEWVLSYAARRGSERVVLLCASKGANDWTEALWEAAERGHENIMLLCASKGANDSGWAGWAGALTSAARGGHVKAMELCETKGANTVENWEAALSHAAENGQESAMLLCGNKGANDWDGALCSAASEGHEKAMLLCAAKGANRIKNWNRALRAAARGGHEKAMLLCEEKGAVDWDKALLGAAEAGHEQAILLCETKGANKLANWNAALRAAASYGREKAMLLCETKGAGDWGKALQNAAFGGHESAMLLCETKSANKLVDWEQALYVAAEVGYERAMLLCAGKGANTLKNWKIALCVAASSVKKLCEDKITALKAMESKKPQTPRMNLQTVLTRPRGPHTAIVKWFQTTARTLFRDWALQCQDKLYAMAELEFYLHDETVHADPYVHCDDAQQTKGEWYFHRASAAKIGFTLKGVDLTFGDNGSYGGILIRGIRPIQVRSADPKKQRVGPLIDGPSRTVDTILTDCEVNSVISLRALEGYEGKAATCPYVGLVHLGENYLRGLKLSAGPRIGLKVRGNDPLAHLYQPAAYRFHAYPYLAKKDKKTLTAITI
jgi:hypothetical protein